MKQSSGCKHPKGINPCWTFSACTINIHTLTRRDDWAFPLDLRLGSCHVINTHLLRASHAPSAFLCFLCVFVCVLMLETKVFHITSTLSPKCKVLLSERTALSFKTNNKRKRSRQYFPSSCMEAFLYQASFKCLFLSHAPESAFQCLKTGPFILRAGLKLAHCHGYKI